MENFCPVIPKPTFQIDARAEQLFSVAGVTFGQAIDNSLNTFYICRSEERTSTNRQRMSVPLSNRNKLSK